MLFDDVQLSRAPALNNIRALFLSLMFTPARNQNLTTSLVPSVLTGNPAAWKLRGKKSDRKRSKCERESFQVLPQKRHHANLPQVAYPLDGDIHTHHPSLFFQPTHFLSGAGAAWLSPAPQSTALETRTRSRSLKIVFPSSDLCST